MVEEPQHVRLVGEIMVFGYSHSPFAVQKVQKLNFRGA
jgi:hypothetical protein